MNEFSYGIELDQKAKKAWLEREDTVLTVARLKRRPAQEPKSPEAISEGLLYLAGDEGLRIEQLANALNKSFEECEAILEKIQNKYAAENFGIELVGYGAIYKFITKKAVFPYAAELLENPGVASLSQSALETLAIIAYKQPITRIEIEELRGVGAEVMLRKLEARNLIREAGRSEAPGRPILYEVTDFFLESFKLYDLKELPELPDYQSRDENEDLFSR